MDKNKLKLCLIKMAASTPISYLMSPLRRTAVPVFMLHRVCDSANGISGVDPDFLKQCLSYLKRNNYSVISIQQLVNCMENQQPLPSKAVVFTCDDGFRDQVEIIAPIFQEFGYPLTIFLISGFIDGNLWPWDDQLAYILANAQADTITVNLASQQKSYRLSDPDQAREALHDIREFCKTVPWAKLQETVQNVAQECQTPIPQTPPDYYAPPSWEQIQKWEKHDITFAPHSVNHAILSRLSDDECRHELNHSWQRLCENLGNPLQVFCYPTGRVGRDFIERDMALVEAAGYKAAFSATPGYAHIHQQPMKYQLRRFPLPVYMSTFIQYCSWIERGKEVLRGFIGSHR